MKKILFTIVLLLVFGGCAFQAPKWQEDAGHIFIPSGDGSVIQEAIDYSCEGGRCGKTITLGQGVWNITEPLKIHNVEGLTIQGVSSALNGTVLKCNTPVCVEILGSNQIDIKDINITGVSMDVGIFLARTPGYPNCSWVNLEHVYIYGQWNYAGVYNVSCESVTLINSHVNSQNVNALSNYTISGLNTYGIGTSVPISEGLGAYRPMVIRTGLTGKAVSSLRVFGVSAIVKDSYIANYNFAGIEVIGKGGLLVDNVAFEGATFASIRLTVDDGDQDYFTLDIASGMGGNSQYGIWADDGTTVQSSKIGNTGLRPLRFDVLVFVDMTNWAAFDSRVSTVTANQCFGVQIQLGQQDVLNCSTKKGVTIYNQSSLHNPKIEYFGYSE